uniref:Uncharacterized protein n=1 Tax=Nothobranchius kadleci TaxID=1051664 RepID=A0A1A8DKR0_NOTKA
MKRHHTPYIHVPQGKPPIRSRMPRSSWTLFGIEASRKAAVPTKPVLECFQVTTGYHWRLRDPEGVVRFSFYSEGTVAVRCNLQQILSSLSLVLSAEEESYGLATPTTSLERFELALKMTWA